MIGNRKQAEDLDRAAEEIERLKANGVHMCIDAFGTGYSSLNALHMLPIDALKIDRKFVASMAVTGRRQRIVETVLDIAHGLDMTVIAEGIEEEGQLHALRGLECAYGQGYLFARPLPAMEASQLIGNGTVWSKLWN